MPERTLPTLLREHVRGILLARPLNFSVRPSLVIALIRRSTLAASTRGVSCPCQASESKLSTDSSEI
jgi:hypothetical protein